MVCLHICSLRAYLFQISQGSSWPPRTMRFQKPRWSHVAGIFGGRWVLIGDASSSSQFRVNRGGSFYPGWIGALAKIASQAEKCILTPWPDSSLVTVGDFLFLGELFAIDHGEVVNPAEVDVYWYPSWMKDNHVAMQVIFGIFCRYAIFTKQVRVENS